MPAVPPSSNATARTGILVHWAIRILSAGLSLVVGCQVPRSPVTGSGGAGLAPARSAVAANAWLEIDVEAFRHNVRRIQTLLPPGTRLCAVMKADAYGNGIAVLAPTLTELGVPYVGITDNAEARQLRRSGFRGGILRLRTPGLAEIREGIRWNIEELVGNAALAREADREAMRAGRKLRIHLALNSAGMSRNGLDVGTPQGHEDALAITRLPHLDVVGMMTHFPVDDVGDVRRGLAKFREQTDEVIRAGGLIRERLLLHCANSFATLEVPETHLDLVRVGAALYGDTDSTHPEFVRVPRFLTRVASINSYPAGNTVNYDRTYTLTRDSRLANLPVGYSDGYRRSLSNRGRVLIRGHRVPVVGRVTMNTIMVDVTDFPDIQAGDEVVLFGRQGAEEITAAEIEEMTGTLLAELYTLWGAANPRIPAYHASFQSR